MISTDLFMELNGDLMWLVDDDDEIDSADNIKRSFRPDVYPSVPPVLTEEDRKNLKAPYFGYFSRDGKFDYLFKNSWIPKGNFEWYKIARRRKIKHMILGDIEYDIPITGPRVKYPALHNVLEKLGVGESFVITREGEEDLEKVRSMVYGKGERLKRKFVMRKNNDTSLRVWRVK